MQVTTVSLVQGGLPTLDDKYNIVRELGTNALGTVYEAEHVAVGKRVAIKLLNGELADDPEARAHILAEARAAARIAHANVVDIHDLGVSRDGVPYLVMELLQGETLAEIVAKRGALPIREGCELTLQILAGLGAAHRKGIVHCDLTLANVVVTYPRPDQPLAKVCDFGLARSIAEGGRPPGAATVGTPMHLAPEQTSAQPIDERTDVYAAATILYVLITGTSPFGGITPAQVLEQVGRGAFRPVIEASSDVPKELAVIIEHGMQRKRKERIGSAEEFAEKLSAFLASPAARISSKGRRAHPVSTLALPNGRVATSARELSHPPDSEILQVGVSPRVTDSLLISPRLPRAPSPPKLEVGRDFMPMLDDPARHNELERRALSTVMPGSGSGTAIMAMLVGFGVGVILAWAAGLI